ncbi:MAG TPA: peptidylprolyl isomerase [Candidatus Hypogeohydataceae bacterium YC40]
MALTISGILFTNVSGATANKPIATVNGEKIYSQEVDKKLDRYKDLDPSMLPVVKKEIVERMVIQHLIVQFLKKEGGNSVSQEVEKTVSNIRDRMKGNPTTAGSTLEELLESQDTNLDEFKASLGLRLYFEKAADDKTINDYFLKNKDTYSGEMVRASHILVKTNPMESPEELNKAKQKIESIKKELDNGADFAELAKKYSDCPSSERGGDIGYFPRKGQVLEAFAATAFALKPGQISGPVKTEVGYHIIKVADRKAVTYDDVKEQVKEDYIEDQTDKLIQKLRQEAKVEITE